MDMEFPSDRCIAIVGMNGAGKSNFGKRLASALRWKRIDTDIVFRKLHGKEQDFIAEKGIDAFHSLEEKIICNSLLPGHVVVLSGGAIESEAVRSALKERAITLWLQSGHKRTHKHLTAAKVERHEFKEGVTPEK